LTVISVQHLGVIAMSDDVSPDLHYIRIDGDVLVYYPAEIQHAIELLMAYADGLADGQKVGTAAPLTDPPQDGPAQPGADLRGALDQQAAGVLAVERQPAAGDAMRELSICGPISGAEPAHGLVPPGQPAHDGSGREMVLVWGPGAYQAIRRLIR
jgi:hypothetical protein